jgi:hypothetical protein
MRSLLSIVFVGLAGLALAACSDGDSDGVRSGGGGTGGAVLDCATLINPPADCDKSCADDSECTASYCENNTTCVAHCTANEGCSEDATCNVSGRCIPNMGTGGTGNTGGTSVCGQLELATDRVIPNIMMIVDRSGSMDWDFSGCDPNDPNDPCEFVAPSRWDAVVDALVGINGLVPELDDIARFGLTLYWKTDGSTSPDGSMCAETDDVAFSENLGATTDDIAATFASNNPDGYTPTAEAIQSVTASLSTSPPPEGPTVYLLATDGQPNGCDQRGEAEDRNNSISAVSAAFELDPSVETFVLGVNFNATHLQDLANAGQGVTSGATLWTADSVQELQTALAQIVEQNIPCTVKLTDGQIDIVQACEGRVTLNDEELACNSTTRGWRALDGTTIELMGSACDDWRGGSADLKAVFPCYVVVQ